MDLLTSQQETHSLEPNPYDYDPVFSTQCTDSPTIDEYTPKVKRESRLVCHRRRGAHQCLTQHKDAVIDNEQKVYAFWSRIADYYAASPKLKGLEKREPSHISSNINEGVCKFVGSYDDALKEKSSGQNENDVMKLANHQIFSNDYDAKFTLEHAWRELRHDQQWCSAPSSKGSGMSKRRMCEESAQSSSSHPLSHGVEEPMPRLIGVKAAKAKAKKTVSKPTSVKDEGKALLEFQSMWEIKNKDLEMEERLSKNKLLDSLLAKTEPLSNIEVNLKNKLIIDMLSNS